ncbi:MAG TPA: ATP-binding protein [Lachnospiraceae bacterium]|nr:ATP-binding protein [Lachnospiraceae bacterium]
MKKNTTLIEKTMNASYRLFSTLKEHDDIDPELARTALNVAKDIHEIKKEYNLILRGISDALDLNLQGDGMYLEEMLRILETATRNKAQEAERHLILTAELPAHIYTQKHYFLMSILRNLFTNAVEASDQETVCLKLAITLENQQYQIAVTDNGPGIDPEDLDQIFQPGFSTKINYTTGEVSRGLGLNLVQDLITNQFHGSIRVDSHPGCTTFTMTIPQNELEENI